MDKQLNATCEPATLEDTALADPVEGASWTFGEPGAEESLPAAEPTNEPEYNKKAEVTKILAVVAVGTIAGIVGGATLAKYWFGPSDQAKTPEVKAPVVATVSKPQPVAPVVSAQPQASTATTEQAPVSAPVVAGTAQPKLVQTSAVQPVKTPAPPAVTASAQQVLGVYSQKKNAATEVIVFLAAPVDVKPEKLANPNRLFFDLPNASMMASALEPVAHVSDGLLKRVRAGRSESGATRLVLDVASGFNFKYAMSSEAPYRLTITLQAE